MVILKDNNYINAKTPTLMRQFPSYLNRYFWLVCVCLWLAIHGLFVHLEYNNAIAIGSELSWAQTWLLMSPWYLSWVWVTAGIFVAIHSNDQGNRTRGKQIFSHVVWMIVLLVSYWAFCSAVGILIRGNSLTLFWDRFIFTLFKTSIIDILIYFCILSSGFGLRFYHNAMKSNIQLKHVQHELAEEQLKTLRSQLNPHFLFNSLNTIASLVRLKREKDAVYALSELSTMLRKILEHKNDPDVKVKEEIAFINSYIAIQKMRFTDKLDTYISVQSDCLELKIPNMILHPLVENAVSHGSQLESNQNPLNLAISRNKNELKLVMTNKVSKGAVHNGFGIGLSNTRERLSKIYTHFTLETNLLNNGLFETLLAIPIGDQDA